MNFDPNTPDQAPPEFTPAAAAPCPRCRRKRTVAEVAEYGADRCEICWAGQFGGPLRTDGISVRMADRRR